MIEAEWLSCRDPDALLEFLRQEAFGRRISSPAAASSGSSPRFLPPGLGRYPRRRSRRAVAVAERISTRIGGPAAELALAFAVAKAIDPLGNAAFAAAIACPSGSRTGSPGRPRWAETFVAGGRSGRRRPTWSAISSATPSGRFPQSSRDGYRRTGRRSRNSPEPSTTKGPSTACRSWPPRWRRPALPTPTCWPISGPPSPRARLLGPRSAPCQAVAGAALSGTGATTRGSRLGACWRPQIEIARVGDLQLAHHQRPQPPPAAPASRPPRRIVAFPDATAQFLVGRGYVPGDRPTEDRRQARSPRRAALGLGQLGLTMPSTCAATSVWKRRRGSVSAGCNSCSR